MGIASSLCKPVASYVVYQQQKWITDSETIQQKWFRYLIQHARDTAFGKAHNFNQIRTYEEFQKAVPVSTYEDLIPYINEIKSGKPNILWPNKPAYLAKTSGTTAGIKYIPISKESIPFHISAARNALLNYIYHTGKASFLDHKLMFLSGSPTLSEVKGVPTGRLSGIVNHHIPSYLKSNQLPSYSINCIEDWEEKVEAIVDETVQHSMGLISGIPPWVQMYFDRIVQRTGKSVKEVFPKFSLLVYGGVNMAPYRKKLFDTIGGGVDSIETYPASEGFIAFQDLPTSEGLLLLLNQGIFYEFIPMEEYNKPNATRLTIQQVELNKNYAIVLSTNAGLWSYSIGDTIKFVSLRPYRIVVTGRVSQYISAFGEHVIAEEVDKALVEALQLHPEVKVTEYTVAPMVAPLSGLPCHEWYIEFDSHPNSLSQFENTLNAIMCRLNIYYNDLIVGKIISTLKIIPIRNQGFQAYMHSIGKLGGQNKVPRLSNDRKIAEELIKFRS